MRKVALATALLLGATSGCGERERAQASNTVDSAVPPPSEPVGTTDAPASFGFEQRQQFAESARQQLAELDRQIEELAAQAKSAGGVVSDRALADIRASRRTLERNLGRVDNATAENWEEIRTAVDRQMESLTEAIEVAYPK